MKFCWEGSAKPGRHFILTFKIRVRYILITMVTDRSGYRAELIELCQKNEHIYEDCFVYDESRFTGTLLFGKRVKKITFFSA